MNLSQLEFFVNGYNVEFEKKFYWKINTPDWIRTSMMKLSKDFKSFASSHFATGAYRRVLKVIITSMGTDFFLFLRLEYTDYGFGRYHFRLLRSALRKDTGVNCTIYKAVVTSFIQRANLLIALIIEIRYWAVA